MANFGSGTGRGGKLMQDRELAAKVRTKALQDIYLVLSDDKETAMWSDLKKQLLVKMSSSILPKLNEVTGEGGAPLFEHVFSDEQLVTVIDNAAAKILKNRDNGGRPTRKRKSD